MQKSVFLDVYCPKKPFDLLILFDNYVLRKKDMVNCQSSKFHFCTQKESFKIIAKHGNLTVFKTIFLARESCQKICTKILFNTSIFQNAHCNISLLDANYGFPVANALLRFLK